MRHTITWFRLDDNVSWRNRVKYTLNTRDLGLLLELRFFKLDVFQDLEIKGRLIDLLPAKLYLSIHLTSDPGSYKVKHGAM